MCGCFLWRGTSQRCDVVRPFLDSNDFTAESKGNPKFTSPRKNCSARSRMTFPGLHKSCKGKAFPSTNIRGGQIPGLHNPLKARHLGAPEVAMTI